MARTDAERKRFIAQCIQSVEFTDKAMDAAAAIKPMAGGSGMVECQQSCECSRGGEYRR